MTINYPELTGKADRIAMAEEIRHTRLEKYAAAFDHSMRNPEYAADTKGMSAMKGAIEALAAHTEADWWVCTKYIDDELRKEYFRRYNAK